jgi:hypothetical protein
MITITIRDRDYNAESDPSLLTLQRFVRVIF